jgi:hypothetical protein
MDCSLPEYTTRSGDGSQRAQSEREKFLLTAHQFLVRVKRVEKRRRRNVIIIIYYVSPSLSQVFMYVCRGWGGSFRGKAQEMGKS